MAVAYGEIARVLEGARRRQVRLVLLAAAGAGVAAALVVLFVGAALVHGGVGLNVRIPVLAGAALALVAAGAWAVRALLATAWSHEAAARRITRDAPALRSALLSSVELSRERDGLAAAGQVSVALVDAHVEETARRAREIDLARALPSAAARKGALALAVPAVATALGLALGGGPFARAYGRLLAGDPAGAVVAAADPITGDVEITYRYPAYMKREERTVSGTGGEIRAPKGTEVVLRTRADRDVKRAEIELAYERGIDVTAGSPSPQPSPRAERGERVTQGEPGEGPAAAPPPPSPPPAIRRHALAVKDARDLAVTFLLEDGGSYRFRYLDAKGRAVAEGPPIPVVLEPDAFPEIRIVAPEGEVEVAPDANVAIAWSAEDDLGLSEAALVLKLPSGDEDRRPLSTLEGARRDAGSYVLQLGPARLAEGERILYWLEVKDTDTVSGPKLAASNTQVVKIYSEAEHRRVALEKAKRAFEELIVLLADRLETFAAGPVTTPDRLVLAENLDARTRQLVQLLRDTAAELRRDRAGPREVAAALQNLSGTLRIAEQRLASIRQGVARFVRARVAVDGGLARQMAAQDGRLDEELEKGILYLEQLLDKRRAEDLVRLAREMARSRRELAGLLEKYRDAPTDAARQAVKDRIARMRERMKDLMARMSELAKGFNDEHMNREALAEMQKGKDMMSALDQVEELLAKGDVEGAMKALDELGGQMDQMVSALQKTAGLPDEKAQALMKEMLAFRKELEEVQARQRQVAGATEEVRAEYRRRIQQRMKEAEKTAKRLERLAAEAREDVERAQPGVSMRAEPDFEAAREGLRDLERALAMRDLDAAMGTVQKTLPSVERLAVGLEEDAEMAERGSAFRPGDPREIRDAMEEARQAVPKTREIKQELAQLMPDPREVLGERQQRRLSELSQEQSALEQRAGQLQQQLQQLAEKAPVFPPQAQGQLGESRGHMGQAAMELGQKNPQRGHGEQQAALDALERFRKGLEDAAKQGQGQGQGGQGFPFPFADSGQSSGQEQMGDGQDPSREKVKIPGAEAHKVPEEFRKDLLEAMKQGAPERYRGEVQRYYEELVK